MLCVLAGCWVLQTSAAMGANLSAVPANSWVQMNATGDGSASQYGQQGLPGGRAWQQVSYDSAFQGIVLFGGSGATYMSDTWTYRPTDNVWHIQKPHPDLNGPCRRDNHNLVYDPIGHLHWLFYGMAYDDLQPGCSTGFDAALGREGIWTYNSATNTWTKVQNATGALHRKLAAGMAYNPNTRSFLEFGGQVTGNNTNTTFVFDPAARTWTQLYPSTSPPGRVNIEGGLLFDQAHGVFVLFGGRTTQNANDTWIFDPTAQNWIQKTPPVSPPPRDLHAMVYDPTHHVVVLHGGRDLNGNPLNDTWVYDVGTNTWTQLSPSGNPPAIFHHSMVYDPVNQLIVLVPGTQSNDTWVFAYQPGSAPGPSPTVPPSGTPGISGQINIPLRTFVVRQLPGNGLSPFGSIKHTRMILNPLNDRLYVSSGDWGGPCTGAQCNGVAPLTSYRNEQWSYGVADDSWVRETDYCQYPNPQPQRPDYNGFAWDSSRHIFWMHGGYQDIDNPTYCNLRNTQRNVIMWFDPGTKLWAGPNGRTSMTTISGINPGLVTYAQYDAVKDTLMWLAFDGSRSCLLRYQIASDTWVKTRFNSTDSVANDARLGESFSAWDALTHTLYVVIDQSGQHPGVHRLYKVAVDTINSNPSGSLTWETIPSNIRVLHDHERIVWDSINNVLLYPFHGGQGWDPTQFQFSVWHPGNPGSWEVIADPANGIPVPTSPANHCAVPEASCVAGGSSNCCLVRGNQIGFDYEQNVLVMYGGSEPPSPYLYLFRYGNGTPTRPSPPHLF
jgi:hypothetical protein